MKIVANAAPLLTAAALLALVGCGTPADSPGMRLSAVESLQMRAWVPEALKYQMVLESVTGGQPTGRFWGAKISNASLQEALSESLHSLGLLSNTPGVGRYLLSVNLVALDQPLFALNMKVSVVMDYTLIDKNAGDKVVYQRRLRSLHTVQFLDSMVDPNERTRQASEEAVHQNVTTMVRELMEMNWPA
ncbi:hypothetical protein [Roseateles koreensis]|uniref:Lipoprotein n=1 Tax=Roseateles koreensis TaxID=2987526 RepID=A0ABT5KW97_9BURK|nr:hypothetical protein [Roseateles koreensis]MDC8787219.1 hypothetical protein [Roseateles koreensis]